MDYRMKRIASCLLAGAIVISGTGVGTYGAQTGGVSAVIATGLSSNGSPAAGFSKMLSQCLIEMIYFHIVVCGSHAVRVKVCSDYL